MMKKILNNIIWAVIAMLPLALGAQTTTENYVVSKTYKVSSSTKLTTTDPNSILKSIQYFDGLGRAKQSIGYKLSPNQKDIITHYAYDAYGRQIKTYLPYAATQNTGAIVSNALTGTNNYYTTHYGSDMNVSNPNPFSEQGLEVSPLNRVLEQAAPGEDWKIGTSYVANKDYSNGHTIKMEYLANAANEVRRYYVSTNFANNTYEPTLQGGTSDYPAGELTKMVTKDENWTTTDGVNKTTEEFKNLQGQVILKRTYNSGAAHDTYYVYDNFGNLTYVLPPKSEADANKPNTTELNELCYQYVYDHRNRLVEKKIPGKGKEYIVYDKLDRPILTQDSIQRAKTSKEWLFTKYDKLGRVVYTGFYKDNGARTALQVSANNSTVVSEYYAGTGVPGTLYYYTNNAFPTNITFLDVYTINYYDEYVFWGGDIVNPTSNAYGVSLTTNTKGLPTTSKVGVLGGNGWITTITGYDDKARPIYVSSKNDYLGTTDIVESKLDFTGKVLETKTTHKKTEKADIVTIDKFTYDHADRLLTQKQKINSQAEELIVSNSYDELGQLISKGVGNVSSSSTRLQTINYDYNVRGWLTDINDVDNIGSDLFTFKINYNKPVEGYHSEDQLYNGNISQTIWKTANDNMKRGYAYQYDNLNRILKATSAKGSTLMSGDSYSIWGIAYDKNGNISRVTRNGNPTGSSTVKIDELYYTYSNNQLLKVNDVATGSAASEGFKNGTNTGNDYTYDANGNMLTDQNKGITNIVYNHLNLPTQVAINGSTINYTYDATGVKQRKVVGSTTTDYAGNHIYENGNLQFFNHAEGYVKKDGSSFDYVYQYKDHLGNVRLTYADSDNNGSINASTEIIEESNYYPFGLKHNGYNNVTTSNGNSVAQKFKYNGIEFEEALDLNLYEMDVRSYDPAIARFTSIDPVIHFDYSTYTAFDNNPVYWADPSGADATSLIQDAWNRSANDGYAYTYDGEGNLTGVTEADNNDDCKKNPEKCKKAKNLTMADAGAMYAKASTITGGGFVAAMDGRDPYNPTAEDDAEAGDALFEAILFISGEWAVVKTLQAGKWIYRTIKVARLAKYSKRVNSIRKALKVPKGRNIGYLEGNVGGNSFSKIGISGTKARGGVGNPTKRFFSTLERRGFDSEVKLLEDFAQQFSGNTNIKGVLKIVSERPNCLSCTNVISQFRKMFPNVKLKIISGVK